MRGCFVALLKPAELADKRDSLAVDKRKKDIEYYKSLGLSLGKLLELVKRYHNGGERWGRRVHTRRLQMVRRFFINHIPL